MESLVIAIFVIIGAGLGLYFLFGLVWNAVISIAWMVYFVWAPIDWLLHRERRYRPRRAY